MTCMPKKEPKEQQKCSVSEKLNSELSSRLAEAFQQVRTLQSEVILEKRKWLESEETLREESRVRAGLEVLPQQHSRYF